jgi:hypothetical protein
MGQWAQWHGGLDGRARLNWLDRRAQLDGLDSMGSTQRAQLDLTGSTGMLDSTGQSACRIASLAHSSLGARSPPHPLSSLTPRQWQPPRIAASPPLHDGALGRSPSLPSTDNDMVWHIPCKLVATQLGWDGCILHCTMRMSQVKTRPEARPTRTDSHAARTGGLTFH